MFTDIKPWFYLVVFLLLGACSSSEPGMSVQTEHECDSKRFAVQIEIHNFGSDTFDVEYEFSAYSARRGEPVTLVGELAGSYEVLGGESITLQKQFESLRARSL